MASEPSSAGSVASTASRISALPTCIAEALHDALSCPPDVIELAVITFAAGGHLLLEDVPGVGKTTLARALARAIDGDVSRIQFTPDMLPGDLTGVSVWSRRDDRFAFHPGPLFANIVIADEINRANPKTQSAMLEAMNERQVSVDGATHPLPDPYFVVATQNPIELEGTYPLPEAQLDRFMTCTAFGYPNADSEAAMITAPDWSHPLDRVDRVCRIEDAAAVREGTRRVAVSKPVADYIVALARGTRRHDGVRYGASPRASLALAAMARARAFIDGRDYVIPDDARMLAVPVLAHRLVLDDAGFAGESLERARAIIADIVRATTVPRA
ncbi:AAA family ATPase [Bifidobacterium platyrrhinorum]|uniref:AAA domain-containing protein n=1 Tax=Bifidobacterium platyrrhinorum TaxID=2661628 RepID=A0A6L9SR33_9BIFI|nr:AAA family ATPase [Bifidobacterium platyrrhinorum]NEG55017.1 AAA domain-containing protein [Bifidobacterium platyrrhinorum]